MKNPLEGPCSTLNDAYNRRVWTIQRNGNKIASNSCLNRNIIISSTICNYRPGDKKSSKTIGISSSDIYVLNYVSDKITYFLHGAKIGLVYALRDENRHLIEIKNVCNKRF